jgi:hypothetical protein
MGRSHALILRTKMTTFAAVRFYVPAVKIPWFYWPSLISGADLVTGVARLGSCVERLIIPCDRYASFT